MCYLVLSACVHLSITGLFDVCRFSVRLAPAVRRRVKALKKLQSEIMDIESEFYKEVHALEVKYSQNYAGLFTKVSKAPCHCVIGRVCFSVLRLSLFCVAISVVFSSAANIDGLGFTWMFVLCVLKFYGVSKW